MTYIRDLFKMRKRVDGVRICAFVITFMFLFSFTPLFSQSIDSSEVKLPVLEHENAKEYIIKDLKVTGVKFLNSQLIANTTGLNKGDKVTIPGDNISYALQLLWSHRYYSDIKAVAQIEGDSVVIEILLKERPRVSMWKLSGVKSGENKEILTKLKLKERAELSDYTINNSINTIKNYYFDKGFFNTEVSVSQVNDTLINNYVMVTFDVNKGPKVKIGQINIEGNEFLSDKKLKASMKKTREKKLVNMFKGAKFTQERYSEDKINLVDYVQSKGYRDGMILKDSIYKIGEDRIGINISIEEGRKYYYRDISFVGNSKHPSTMLNDILGIRKGDTYDKKSMESRLGTDGKSAMEGALTVSSVYQNDGHLMFQLEPVETVIDGDSIDIEIRMSEGKQFTVNEVGISGNNRTNDRVVRRELYVRPGELYSQELLVSSIRKVGMMGHFNPEKVMPDIQPVSDELVNLGFNLEEQASDQFEVSGGWGAKMFVASVGVTFNNVSLRKAFKRDAWKPYPSGDNQQLKIKVQSNGTYYKALSFSFVEPWFGGKKPNSFSLSAYYSDQSNAYYAWQAGTSHFMTIGASIGYGKRLGWPDPNFQIMGELMYQAYNLKDWSGFLMTNGVSNTIAASATISRSSTDQFIYPRRGSEMMLKLTMTPPISLLNGKDYSQVMSDQDRYAWIEYYKWNGSFKWFTSMLSNSKLVLMTKADFGYLGHYNSNNVSPFEGFRVGGDGMTGYNLYGIQNIGLRGYEESSLTPNAVVGEQARMYTKYTLELRYPIVLSPSSSVYALLFGEAGNAWNGWRDFNPFNLKRSLGFGVRLYLPIIGMFGIDWGYGFDATQQKPNERSGSQFHFSIGQQF